MNLLMSPHTAFMTGWKRGKVLPKIRVGVGSPTRFRRKLRRRASIELLEAWA
ncbi:MAG: hypothetical protein BWX71_02212 [Deltaproteobacteria bacterium ADurb.Bin072]|nr:MAG: hypothetical protein BWX71_02212 [Deltaproteobacteria bacterium ADurb.Bin072]